MAVRGALGAGFLTALLVFASALPIAVSGSDRTTGAQTPAALGTRQPAVEPSAPPAGPPFPDHVAGRWVYDYAGVFSPETIAKTQATIDAIEARTGAQIAVYTQLKPGATTDSTERDAIALMDQWGVGRKGFDDGLVVLWNLDSSLKHGQVQLYAGPGFRLLVTNEQRQAIFDHDMLPLLRKGDLDGAMIVAIARMRTLLTPLATEAAAGTTVWRAKVGTAGANGTATLAPRGSGATLRLALKALTPATAYPVSIVKGTCALPGPTLWAARVQTSTAAGKIVKSLTMPAAQLAPIRLGAGVGPVAIRIGNGLNLRCGPFTIVTVASASLAPEGAARTIVGAADRVAAGDLQGIGAR
jgi:uncharacterized membrane protein YgcG